MMTTAPHLRLSFLGGTEVRLYGRPVPVRGRLTRALLTRLAVARSAVVPRDELIGDLWPKARPADPYESLHSFVYALRRALEPDRLPRAPATVVVSESSGYALRLDGSAVDTWHFDALARSATGLLLHGLPGPAARRIDEALELWRGPALAEFAASDWAFAEAARLETLRELALSCRESPATGAGTRNRQPTRPQERSGWAKSGRSIAPRFEELASTALA